MEPHAENGMPHGGVQVPAVKPISGKELAKALKAGTVTPDFTAWLAYRLQVGGAWLHHLTAKQARQVTGAICADLAAERRKNRPANGNGKRVLYRRNPTEADVDAIVAKLGPDKVMQALDRMTKPRCARTGEMFGASR